MRALITGGAGFIGTHLSRRLLAEGLEVAVLDAFTPQVHGDNRDLAPDLRGAVRLVRGDIRDEAALRRALAGVEAVVHLAAETGTGQSMYEVARYSEVNLQGTAQLMDLLVNDPDRRVRHLVVASSRAVYGEGRYRCPLDGVVFPPARSRVALALGRFEPACPVCGLPLDRLPTTEDTPPAPTSFYGLTKLVQEKMGLLFGGTLGISTHALRYQNVFGPGQSLQNPYTGILAIFSGLARSGETLRIFEDGLESRDFVHVRDVVEATWRALNTEAPEPVALNVGSGVATTVAEVAEGIVRHLGSRSRIQVTGEFRIGDIRHNTADLTRVREQLGFTPTTAFQEDLEAFLDWAAEERPATGGYARSLEELRSRRLMNV
ncbi:nucleoside-diphosphate-sugar epimerase [Geothrix rubra]|uniref:Nucleoside-diphosphate-sugar epimerase n=1 Tax=Geothrix rubra TaxID=2927977 RepID=A0ABQ5Q2T0_9BACT|nr:NAD-dependent epimerase/dehydratase family protein [Geothrix rubra]GLH68730.1 nucleoside-diphosphate-sugar epimerase [Geothrix rubra]